MVLQWAINALLLFFNILMNTCTYNCLSVWQNVPFVPCAVCDQFCVLYPLVLYNIILEIASKLSEQAKF